jgi:hypothetical protein
MMAMIQRARRRTGGDATGNADPPSAGGSRTGGEISRHLDASADSSFGAGESKDASTVWPSGAGDSALGGRRLRTGGGCCQDAACGADSVRDCSIISAVSIGTTLDTSAVDDLDATAFPEGWPSSIAEDSSAASADKIGTTSPTAPEAGVS